MRIITEKLVAGGSCLAHIDGKAVFIPYTLPGETHEIQLVEDKKDYSRALSTSILDPSVHRIAPECPLFGRCGGCSLQMADTAYQRELRLGILRDSLQRSRVADCPEPDMVIGAATGYRSRFQFHIPPFPGLALKEGSSAEFVPVADCPVAVPEIRERLRDGSLSGTARTSGCRERFNVFGWNGSLWQEGSCTVCDPEICGKKIRFDIRGFFQSNIELLETLLAEVLSSLEGCGTGRLLDFYAGVGTFSAFASDRFRETVLMEHNTHALEFARANVSESRIVLCPVSDQEWPFRKESRLVYDAAIVDPPRQGLHRSTVHWFASSGIPLVVYVSCDPVTFARDAAVLVSGGYRLERVSGFDFYPQTHHLEVFGVFRL